MLCYTHVQLQYAQTVCGSVAQQTRASGTTNDVMVRQTAPRIKAMKKIAVRINKAKSMHVFCFLLQCKYVLTQAIGRSAMHGLSPCHSLKYGMQL